MTYKIRRLELTDLEARVKWFNDQRINRYMSISPPFSISETKKWYQTTLLNDSRIDFTVEDSDSGEAVSMGGLTDIDHDNGHAELYIFVDPTKHKSGIGERTVKWICNYGFNAYNFNKIYLHTLSHNDPAKNLYQKLGFQHEGVLRDHVYHNGQRRDRNIMSILQTEWQDTNWSQSEGFDLEMK